MKYIIKIDRETIKKNPNAERTVFHYPLRPSYEYNEDGTVKNIRQEYQTLYSLTPDPEFLYEYILTLVKCEYCNEEFYHNELQSEDWGDYGYSDTVCPKCNVSNCCEIQFESIKEVN